MKRNLQIAIDGPVAAGKSVLSSALAKKLKLLYLYTGAMYRALALLAKKKGVDLKDEQGLLKILKKSKISFKKAGKGNSLGYSVFLDGENITETIRTPEFGWGASVVGTLPKVRKFMVQEQRRLAKGKVVVMEGRDIAVKVLPEAHLKIYLTADQKTRAKRRQRQLYQDMGIKKDFKKILKEIKIRDKQDSGRKTDPLKITSDMWVLDTTVFSPDQIDQVVEQVVKKLKELKLL